VPASRHVAGRLAKALVPGAGVFCKGGTNGGQLIKTPRQPRRTFHRDLEGHMKHDQSRLILGAIIAMLLGLMTVVTFANVVARYAFNSNILWALELTSFLFAWLVLLGRSPTR
jgi:hypothetical protein